MSKLFETFLDRPKLPHKVQFDKKIDLPKKLWYSEQWPNCLNIKKTSSTEFLCFFLGVWAYESHLWPGPHSHPWKCHHGDACWWTAHLLYEDGCTSAFPLEPEFLDQERPGLSPVASMTIMLPTEAILSLPCEHHFNGSQPPGDVCVQRHSQVHQDLWA